MLDGVDPGVEFNEEEAQLAPARSKPVFCLVIVKLLVRLLIVTLSRSLIICSPHGGPLRAQGILGNVMKITVFYFVFYLRSERTYRHTLKAFKKTQLIVWPLVAMTILTKWNSSE